MSQNIDLERRMKKVQDAFARAMSRLDELKKKQDELIKKKNQEDDNKRIIELRKALTQE
jgi:hypothetical protein